MDVLSLWFKFDSFFLLIKFISYFKHIENFNFKELIQFDLKDRSYFDVQFKLNSHEMKLF